MKRLPALLLVCLLALVSGCGAEGLDNLLPSAAGDAVEVPSYPEPVRLEIPGVNIVADVVHIDMDAQRRLDVTPLDKDPDLAGWYVRSARVGQIGPMVIAAHVDYNGPAAFYKLRQVKTPAEVYVIGEDGTRRVYEVYKTRQVKKSQFPSQEVYGRVEQPELRLITCGGAFDSSRRSYVDNVIVFARLKSAEVL